MLMRWSLKISMKSNDGFTLVEVLLYSALVALVLTAAVQLIFVVLENKEKNESVQAVEEHAELALARISQTVRQSADIVRTGPRKTVFDTNPGRLTVAMPGGTEIVFDTYSKSVSQGTRTFSVTALRRTQTGAASVDLTSGEVNVTQFIIRNRTQGTEPDNVKVEFTLASANPDNLLVRAASVVRNLSVSRRTN